MVSSRTLIMLLFLYTFCSGQKKEISNKDNLINKKKKIADLNISQKIAVCDTSDIFGEIVELQLRPRKNRKGNKLFKIKGKLGMSAEYCSLIDGETIDVALRITEDQKIDIINWKDNDCQIVLVKMLAINKYSNGKCGISTELIHIIKKME